MNDNLHAERVTAYLEEHFFDCEGDGPSEGVFEVLTDAAMQCAELQDVEAVTIDDAISAFLGA